jgi:hypothetical protein
MAFMEFMTEKAKSQAGCMEEIEETVYHGTTEEYALKIAKKG